MNKQDRKRMNKLLDKAELGRGLDGFEHKELIRLINQLDAEEALLTRDHGPGKAAKSRELCGKLPTLD